MKTAGQPLSDSGIQEMIESGDKNNDGQLNYEGSIVVCLRNSDI